MGDSRSEVRIVRAIEAGQVKVARPRQALQTREMVVHLDDTAAGLTQVVRRLEPRDRPVVVPAITGHACRVSAGAGELLLAEQSTLEVVLIAPGPPMMAAHRPAQDPQPLKLARGEGGAPRQEGGVAQLTPVDVPLHLAGLLAQLGEAYLHIAGSINQGPR